MQADHERRTRSRLPRWAVSAVVVSLMVPSMARSQSKDIGASSYDQVTPVLLGKETFQDVMARDKAEKAAVMARQKQVLEERYDLTNRPDPKITMSRGKPIPVGPTASCRRA